MPETNTNIDRARPVQPTDEERAARFRSYLLNGMDMVIQGERMVEMGKRNIEEAKRGLEELGVTAEVVSREAEIIPLPLR